MKCEICGKEILRDSQCINYKYYHNGCIENLQQENQKFQERIEYLERSNNRREDTIIGYRLEDIGIVAELEEWLKETRLNSVFIDEQTIMEVQLKIQELKEKYK